MEMIRVVIADDDPITRELLAMLMRQERISVVGEAFEGLAAVELSLQLRPDVAVLDRRMPELEGDTAAQVLRTLCPEMGLILLSSEPSTVAPEVMRSVDAIMSKADVSSVGTVVRDVAMDSERCGFIRIA